MSRRNAFELSNIPVPVLGLKKEHHGLRIAHLTDFHVGVHTPETRLTAAVQAVNDLRPDLVVLTGDYVTWSKRPVSQLSRVLGGFRGPVYCVLGNHDHRVGASAVRRQLEAAGYVVLQNEHRRVSVRGQTLHVVGVDDERTGHADVDRAFHGVPSASGPVVVLTHVPTTSERLPPHRSSVCFAGHTHGGQFHVGNLTRRLAHRLGHRYLVGLHAVNGNHLYVGRGLAYGKGSLLPRRRCPPEVAMIHLCAA